MCNASNTTAEIDFDSLPLIDSCVLDYIKDGCIPGGTTRNFDSYGSNLSLSEAAQRNIVCDPQTSGGLLIAVDPEDLFAARDILKEEGLWANPIGRMIPKSDYAIIVL